MSGLADTPLEAISDELLLNVAGQHLAKRLQVLELRDAMFANGGSLPPQRRQLLDLLEEGRRRDSNDPLRAQLIRASETAKVSIFDIEDEQLVNAMNGDAPTRPGRQSLQITPHNVGLADENNTFRREDMYGPDGR